MKQQHTMAKRAREQAQRERRERKQAKKQAARDAKLAQPEPSEAESTDLSESGPAERAE